MVRGLGCCAALVLTAFLCPVLAADGVADNASGRVLTNAQQVLDLGLDRARGSDIPVRLRGVMTYEYIFKRGWFFVQDETAATLVIDTNLPFELQSGQLLEVEGVAAAGIWMPFVQGSAVRVVGEAPLPKAKLASPAKLAAGEDFGRWVEISGTVRDLAVTKKRLLLQCTDHGLPYQVWIIHPDEFPLPLNLLDAKVRVQGISWPDVTYERRPFGFKLHMPSTNYLQVLKHGSADIFSAESRTIASLRRFKGDRDTRVKVTGVVTAHSPAGWIALKDDTGTLIARQLAPLPRDDDPRAQFIKRDQPPLQPGDRIELVGAPVPDRPFAPILEASEYRVVGHAAPPIASALAASDLMTGRHDAELVNVKARVVDVERRRSAVLFEQRLWLQSEDATFEATLVTRQATPLAVRQNDFVSVTGICSLQPGSLQQVRSFTLNLRGTGDLTATNPPRRWVLRWAAWLLASAGALGVAAVVWIAVLRRQVSRRTAELSKANEQLEAEMKQRRRLASIIEATSDFVGMANLQGQMLYLNRAGRRIVEISDDYDVRGLNIERFYPADVNRLFQEVAMPVAMRDGLWTGEVRLLATTGREIPISFVGLVVKNPDGTPEHLACVARDISDRKRIEVELRAALEAEIELNRLKSNFVSMVSHEFRTPLGAIQSSAELLQHYEERLSPERRAKLLAAIVSSSGEMARMMEDVLLLSRVESARYGFHPCELTLADFCRRLVDEITSATHGRCPIRLTLENLPETVRCDEGLLRHIFNNLLSNAVKYSPAGSTVDLSVQADGQDAVFTVRDQGAGIASEDQSRLFQPFERGRNVTGTPGTGLGLVIVQRCVNLHGGSMRLTSAPGQGTTVTVRLPIFVEKDTDTALVRRWTTPATPQPNGES